MVGAFSMLGVIQALSKLDGQSVNTMDALSDLAKEMGAKI